MTRRRVSLVNLVIVVALALPSACGSGVVPATGVEIVEGNVVLVRADGTKVRLVPCEREGDPMLVAALHVDAADDFEPAGGMALLRSVVKSMSAPVTVPLE